MKVKQIELIVSTQETFDSYAKELGTHPTNVAIELIGLAYKLDGDDLNDDDLLELIAQIIERNNNSNYKGE